MYFWKSSKGWIIFNPKVDIAFSEKKCKIIFKGGSKAIWNFSENSSVLVPSPVPKRLRYNLNCHLFQPRWATPSLPMNVVHVGMTTTTPGERSDSDFLHKVKSKHFQASVLDSPDYQFEDPCPPNLRQVILLFSFSTSPASPPRPWPNGHCSLLHLPLLSPLLLATLSSIIWNTPFVPTHKLHDPHVHILVLVLFHLS